jgi:hypothetical protein
MIPRRAHAGDLDRGIDLLRDRHDTGALLGAATLIGEGAAGVRARRDRVVGMAAGCGVVELDLVDEIPAAALALNTLPLGLFGVLLQRLLLGPTALHAARRHPCLLERLSMIVSDQCRSGKVGSAGGPDAQTQKTRRRGRRVFGRRGDAGDRPARRHIFFDFFFIAFFFVGFMGSAAIGALPGPPRDTAGPPELWPVDDCWANAGAAASSIAAEASNRTFFIVNSWMRAVQRPAPGFLPRLRPDAA